MSSTDSDKEKYNAFDIALMDKYFKECQEIDGISLQPYSDGFKQILNFFAVLGKIFTFVASDVGDKIRIIDEHCSGERADDYKVLDTVMIMEKEENIAQICTKQFASCSRTVLRLHRAMEFIARLFETLAVTEEHHIGHLSKDIYKATLANYHPFMVRKAAEFGMLHGLPYREKLMDLIGLKNSEGVLLSEDEARELLKETAKTMLKCHSTVDQLYTKHDLHSLP